LSVKRPKGTIQSDITPEVMSKYLRYNCVVSNSQQPDTIDEDALTGLVRAAIDFDTACEATK
jgi:hypothetical protein